MVGTHLVFPDTHRLVRLLLNVEPYVINRVLLLHPVIKCHHLHTHTHAHVRVYTHTHTHMQLNIEIRTE